MRKIDLNCDLGEWRGDDGYETDQAIMPVLSSCNIACGGHIGNKSSMRKTVKLALAHGVEIGAHPSYPDRKSFGRRRMEIASRELEQTILDQILSLKTIVEEHGSRLHHVKPHGALYNTASIDRETADIIVKAIKRADPKLKVYGQPAHELEKAALASGLEFVAEVFADRRYEDNLQLRPRNLDGAVLHRTEEVLDQVGDMVLAEEVETYSGIRKPIRAQTICLHSDTKGSAGLARKIYDYLVQNDVEIGPP